MPMPPAELNAWAKEELRDIVIAGVAALLANRLDLEADDERALRKQQERVLRFLEDKLIPKKEG